MEIGYRKAVAMYYSESTYEVQNRRYRKTEQGCVVKQRLDHLHLLAGNRWLYSSNLIQYLLLTIFKR